MVVYYDFDICEPFLWVIVALFLVLIARVSLWGVALMLVLIITACHLMGPQAPVIRHEYFALRAKSCPYANQRPNQIGPARIKPIALVPIWPSPAVMAKALAKRKAQIKPLEGNKDRPKPMSICEALKEAGFKPQWTYSEVSKMMKTSEGKKAIKDLNDLVVRKTQS